MANDETLGRFSETMERDVDLLLLEEICCSPFFCSWFYEQVSAQMPAGALPKLVDFECIAERSVGATGDGYGETDILVTIRGIVDDVLQVIVFLIEDKIDATFTSNQIARYRQRLLRKVAEQECASGACVLVAPGDYLASVAGFDARISYESVAGFLESRANKLDAEAAARYRHRSSLLWHAVRKHRRGYTPVVDEKVNTFFDEYEAHTRRDYPSLELKPRRDRGTYARAFYFELPGRREIGADKLFIVHHYEKGEAAIEMRGLGPHAEWYLHKLASLLDQGMLPRLSGRETLQLLIRNLPHLDGRQAFAGQALEAEKCLQAVQRLRGWYLARQHDFARWVAERPDRT